MSYRYPIAVFSLLLIGISSCGSPTNQVVTEEITTSQPTEQSEISKQAGDTRAEVGKSDKFIPKTSTPSTTELDKVCNGAVTQIELNECAHAEYEVLDAARNQSYQALSQHLLNVDKSTDSQEALSTAELAWAQFREQDCDFARNQYVGGSIAPLIYYDCLSDKTQKRTAELASAQFNHQADQSSNNQTLDVAAEDASLNQQYQALLPFLSPENEQAIASVQLSWIDYRDRNCDFEATYINVKRDQCIARMSKTRSAELEEIVEARSL